MIDHSSPISNLSKVTWCVTSKILRLVCSMAGKRDIYHHFPPKSWIAMAGNTQSQHIKITSKLSSKFQPPKWYINPVWRLRPMLVNKCCEKSQWQSLWKCTTSEGWQHIWEAPNLKHHWDQLMATSFEDSPINHDRSQVAPRHRKGRGHVWVAWAAHQDEVPVPSVS